MFGPGLSVEKLKEMTKLRLQQQQGQGQGQGQGRSSPSFPGRPLSMSALGASSLGSNGGGIGGGGGSSSSGHHNERTEWRRSGSAGSAAMMEEHHRLMGSEEEAGSFRWGVFFMRACVRAGERGRGRGGARLGCFFFVCSSVQKGCASVLLLRTYYNRPFAPAVVHIHIRMYLLSFQRGGLVAGEGWNTIDRDPDEEIRSCLHLHFRLSVVLYFLSRRFG